MIIQTILGVPNIRKQLVFRIEVLENKEWLQSCKIVPRCENSLQRLLERGGDTTAWVHHCDDRRGKGWLSIVIILIIDISFFLRFALASLVLTVHGVELHGAKEVSQNVVLV